MGERHNWIAVPTDSSASTLHPAAGSTFDLMNRTALKLLAYGHRDYGINLVWAHVGASAGHIYFQRPGTATGPLLYGESVAIGVRGGGFLRYRDREYGINLDWSAAPVFEWHFEGTSNAPDAVVRAGERVGLYNEVVGDVVFYDPRRYGINLKWLKDEGKFNDTPWYADVANFVSSLAGELQALWEELLQRGLGLADGLLTLVGIMVPKRIRLRVVVLATPTAGPCSATNDSRNGRAKPRCSVSRTPSPSPRRPSAPS